MLQQLLIILMIFAGCKSTSPDKSTKVKTEAGDTEGGETERRPFGKISLSKQDINIGDTGVSNSNISKLVPAKSGTNLTINIKDILYEKTQLAIQKYFMRNKELLHVPYQKKADGTVDTTPLPDVQLSLSLNPIQIDTTDTFGYIGNPAGFEAAIIGVGTTGNPSGNTNIFGIDVDLGMQAFFLYSKWLMSVSWVVNDASFEGYDIGPVVGGDQSTTFSRTDFFRFKINGKVSANLLKTISHVPLREFIAKHLSEIFAINAGGQVDKIMIGEAMNELEQMSDADATDYEIWMVNVVLPKVCESLNEFRKDDIMTLNCEAMVETKKTADEIFAEKYKALALERMTDDGELIGPVSLEDSLSEEAAAANPPDLALITHCESNDNNWTWEMFGYVPDEFISSKQSDQNNLFKVVYALDENHPAQSEDIGWSTFGSAELIGSVGNEKCVGTAPAGHQCYQFHFFRTLMREGTSCDSINQCGANSRYALVTNESAYKFNRPTEICGS